MKIFATDRTTGKRINITCLACDALSQEEDYLHGFPDDVSPDDSTLDEIAIEIFGHRDIYVTY